MASCVTAGLLTLPGSAAGAAFREQTARAHPSVRYLLQPLHLPVPFHYLASFSVWAQEALPYLVPIPHCSPQLPGKSTSAALAWGMEG